MLFSTEGVLTALVHVSRSVAVETVIVDGRERVEVFAAAHGLGGVALEDEARVVAVEVFDEELGAPLEGAHDAVRVARGVPAFLCLD